MFDSIFFWRRCEKPEANPIFSYLTLSRVFQFPAIIPSDTGIMITRERCIAFIGYARNAKMHVNKYINKRRYTQRLKSLCERDYENIFQWPAKNRELGLHIMVEVCMCAWWQNNLLLMAIFMFFRTMSFMCFWNHIFNIKSV